MYGTIARIKIDPAQVDELMALGNNMDMAHGQVARYVYQMDANPSEFYLTAVFESKEAYWANASSPEQHERFMRLRALLLEDPQWHDGEIVSAA